VPIDDDGLDVDALAALLDGGVRPKLLYTIPEHQNPGGVMLAAERRTALVELARRYGFLIVEDVAYRELTFDGAPPESLWSLGPDVVVQAGTTSKTFFPGVRLGWGVGPAEVIARLVSAKQNTDQCAGALGQTLYEAYVRRGWIDEQLAASRALYAHKAVLLLDALRATMPAGVEWTTPRGGFFTWLTLPVDATEFAKRAADVGVAVVPGALFYPDGRGERNVRISFSMVDESLIATGVERLASLLH
jgi:2-aminoadipate transaminase